jgi:hypothetical protein
LKCSKKAKKGAGVIHRRDRRERREKKEKTREKGTASHDAEPHPKTHGNKQKLLLRFSKNPNKKFFGGPGGDFSKKPPGRRRQEN